MLCDGGANNECRPEMLAQFGRMGAVYMQKVMGLKDPRVGLQTSAPRRTRAASCSRRRTSCLRRRRISPFRRQRRGARDPV